MGNNKEKAITKMSMKLREENAPAIVEIKVVDDEFSSYMERKIQDDTYRFSVLADLLKRKKQGEVFSISFRQSTTSIGATHRMGVGECHTTYWFLIYSCTICKLFSLTVVTK